MTIDTLLRKNRLPHLFCPGCGIGTSLNCFLRAVKRSGMNPDLLAMVSGIGCSGRVAGYVNLDSFHTTHGRAIPFATGLKMANPRLSVVVYSGEGDLVSIGGNHLLHAARRNMDLLVVCVNNQTYGMTGGQATPTTPEGAMASMAPYGSLETPANLPLLLHAAGANYVARWTTYHVRELTKAFEEAFLKRGFRFIEIISPCPAHYLRRNKLGDGLSEMIYYKAQSEINSETPLEDLDIILRRKIIVGCFVDRDRPSYLDKLRRTEGQEAGKDAS